jgi:hypothetical protein
LKLACLQWLGVADAHRYILGSQPQFFGDDLCQQRADTAVNVLHGGTQLTEPLRSSRTSQAALVWTMPGQNDWATPTPRFTGPRSALAGRRQSQPNRSAPIRRSSRRIALGSIRSRSARSPDDG